MEMLQQRSEVNGDATSRGHGGVKRKADNDLDDEQRFAKRLELLNIGRKPDRSSNLYIPVQNDTQHNVPPQAAQVAVSATSSSRDESMNIDDTRDRVYIHNLDDELADIESEEEKIVFLPDIEARLSKIPQHVLSGRSYNEDNEGQELVLYSVPKSLTVSEEQDSVRKAILEARHRAREKATEKARLEDMALRYGPSNGDGGWAEMAHGYSYEAEPADDPDAMDIE